MFNGEDFVLGVVVFVIVVLGIFCIGGFFIVIIIIF